MSRITIYNRPPEDPFAEDYIKTPVGSFRTETAEYWEDPDSTSRVWLTKSGRWVWTATDRTEYLTPEEARGNLTRWGFGAEATERIEHRDGPGRPEIGPEIKTRLPVEAIEQLDAMAATNGVSRAEQMRQIILDGIWLS